MSDTSQCTESDEESTNGHGPFAHPYASSYGFAATSWQLRKNLTETFNQHVVIEEKKETNNHQRGRKMMRMESKSSSSSSSHIASNKTATAVFEKKPAARSKAFVANTNNRPPRQPAPSLSSSSSLMANSTKNDGKRCVSVYLRIRPPKTGMVNTIEIIPGQPPTKVRTHAPAKSNAAKINREHNNSGVIHQSEPPLPVVREFDFQEVFGPEKENKDVYSKIVAPMVNRLLPNKSSSSSSNEGQRTTTQQEPESGLLFAYGATNAGKTYSVLGPNKKDEEQRHLGIVPLAIADIIQKMSSGVDHQRFELYMSYFEIYNENIYDLLEDRTSRNPIRESLKLRESQNKNIIIRGLQKRRIKDVEEGLKLARQANSKRQTSSNNLNSNSSRSHCICQLQVYQRGIAGRPMMREESTGTLGGYNTEEEATEIAKQKPTSLWIVDLAGSERNKRTNVGTIRQREASAINKSLSNLMRCLSIIRENQSATSSSQIIPPFRESKLTHLFMPIFTGRSASSISMIVNVNPAAPDFDETSHVLSYASQAKLVQISKSSISEKETALQRGGEYGFNVRPIKKSSSTTTSKMAKLLKKLSPKKIVRGSYRSNVKPKNHDENLNKKRKTGLPRVASFSSTTSNGSQNPPKAKRIRVTKPSASNSQNSKTSSSSSSSASDANALKLALSIAQAEIEVLKSDKAKMTQEMEEVEGKIRFEVSEEMEEQLESTKRHYTGIINAMKSQKRQSVGVFEKRAREEKASEEIEVLLFKAQEAEEEMQRMAVEHQDQIMELQQQHANELSTLQNVIAELQGQLKQEVGEPDALRLRVSDLEQELEALKKSKTDLIAAYEKLLGGGDEGSEEEESEDDSPEPAGPRYRTRSGQKMGLQNH